MIGPRSALTLAAIASIPTGTPVHWAEPSVSSGQFESHAAFDPWTGDLWFVRSTPQFSGWRLKVSRCAAAGRSKPVDPPFAAGKGVEADPWFAPGGRTLWFISTRSDDGVTGRGLDIWRVTRNVHGRWGRPERLPEPINSAGQEWFPRIGRDGWLYFGSDRPGGFGKTDIWRARQRHGRWQIENAGPALNSADDEYEALPSPDGRWLLLAAGDGYYRSERRGLRWQPRVRLGPEVNATGSEIGATFSPSGRSWLFSRRVNESLSGEFMRVGQSERWPQPCPRIKSSPVAPR